MASYYLESSALVKRYVVETGTAWVRGLAAPASGNTLFIAQITGVEAVAAITLRARRGATSPSDAVAAIANFRRNFALGYYALPVTLAVIGRAMDLAEKHGLRGYDAVQLATALQVQSQRRSNGLPAIVFVSVDAPLNAAAAAEGLAVDDPNAHP
jgi:predicted nucleic acid-binding protein